MSKEDRIHFEATLQKELNDIKCAALEVRAVKRGLKFRLDKKVVAELHFQYLVKSHAFTLIGFVSGGPIFDGVSKMDIPYQSNLGSESCFSFTTSGRQDKKLGPRIDGRVDIPQPEKASDICRHIRHVLEDYYIPLLIGCILPGERTVDDVVHSPTDYAYPAVFIHCALAYNPSILKDGMLEKIRANKYIIKNKTFDLALLNSCQLKG
ncbi:hypothetical protein SAMN05216588_1219 [Pseudomonas flavescens]|uniref:Uncharacterized protein n=1 Tax=Phytopseudomonas flavescens TaxID=29435 RepID=A0A1G8M8X2_9GAMM|nr:hypothetical protein [Pseudomonas flavescens]SDI64325.1 hypothetical protein SAMN05216588_1219 [Pseudomonas flavescens]